MTPSINQVWSRYEYKYQLDRKQLAVVERFIDLYCEPDSFGDQGRYEVDSLYFDTWDGRLAEQTI